jgi:adenylate cyclase, class 2
MEEGRRATRARAQERPNKAAHVRVVTNHRDPKPSILLAMASHNEIEIKFRIANVPALNRRLQKAGFRLVTRRTHEMNTLYDLPGQRLRKRGELIRLRKYGPEWLLTHKARGEAGRHKTRVETETKVADGAKMEAILRALGFAPTFRYEKFRAEWSDGKGHVVVDETPIGNFGEIEGPSRWIDRTAQALQVARSDYITTTYSELFFEWKKQSESCSDEMTFSTIQRKPRR